jgi:acyl-CoA thioesterase-2
VPHSLHCYFLRAGDPLKPVVYHVHRDRDGRSYSARTVSAMQGGREILTMSASFHVLEHGPDVQSVTLPEVPDPEDPACRPFTGRTLDIVYRDPSDGPRDHMIRRVWAKAAVDLGSDPLLHACVVTYISDMFTGLFSLVPRRDDVALSSLDHAIWFMRDARADDWLFMELHGESLHGGRGLYSGDMYDGSGVLIAKLIQESLFRPRAPQS